MFAFQLVMYPANPLSRLLGGQTVCSPAAQTTSYGSVESTPARMPGVRNAYASRRNQPGKATEFDQRIRTGSL